MKKTFIFLFCLWVFLSPTIAQEDYHCEGQMYFTPSFGAFITQEGKVGYNMDLGLIKYGGDWYITASGNLIDYSNQSVGEIGGKIHFIPQYFNRSLITFITARYTTYTPVNKTNNINMIYGGGFTYQKQVNRSNTHNLGYVALYVEYTAPHNYGGLRLGLNITGIL